MKKLAVVIIGVLIIALFWGLKSKSRQGTEASQVVKVEKNGAAKASGVPAVAELDNSAEGGVTAQTLNAADTVAATVNGETITEAQMAERMGRLRTGAPVAEMPESLREPFESNLRDKVFNDLVLETLLMQKVREKRIVVSSQEIAACIDRQCQLQKMNQNELLRMLEAKGQTLEAYSEEIRRDKIKVRSAL